MLDKEAERNKFCRFTKLQKDENREEREETEIERERKKFKTLDMYL